ncbi:MAG: hypothetical protein ACHQD9_02370 [Chitinophagales bacterium]
MSPRRGRVNIYLGAFFGFVFPVIGFLLYYVFVFSDQLSLSEYWNFLFNSGNIAAALSLAIIMNLPVFFLSLWSNKYETVKGIVGATIFYGALIIIFKFF